MHLPVQVTHRILKIRTYAYQRVKNVGFLENLTCFVFFWHTLWDSHFYLITDGIRKIRPILLYTNIMLLLNYNTSNNMSFIVSKISLIYWTTPINFTNDQNTMHRVIWGYIYTFTIKIRKKKPETFLFSLLY